MRSEVLRLLPWMTVFFLAMALLESAVVVYLRALHYPDGFRFPLVPMDGNLVTTELLREGATIIMLLAVASVATRKALERFAWFCFGFGVWDLGYYAWLKVLLDWPAAWTTDDLLFLLPLPWVGPVWAPCMIALGLVLLGLVLLVARSRMPTYRVRLLHWSLLVSGAIAMILVFMADPWTQGFRSMDEVALGLNTYVPGPFPTAWFLLSAVPAAAGLVACAMDALMRP